MLNNLLIRMQQSADISEWKSYFNVEKWKLSRGNRGGAELAIVWDEIGKQVWLGPNSYLEGTFVQLLEYSESYRGNLDELFIWKEIGEKSYTFKLGPKSLSKKQKVLWSMIEVKCDKKKNFPHFIFNYQVRNGSNDINIVPASRRHFSHARNRYVGIS